MSTDPLDILLVEDDEESALLVQTAIEIGNVNVKLHVVIDGVYALDYLQGRNEYAGASKPDVIILDLNLPRKSGHDVLKAISEDSGLREIPIVLFTTTNQNEELRKEFGLQRNSCYTKPDRFDDYIDFLRKVETDFRSGRLFNGPAFAEQSRLA